MTVRKLLDEIDGHELSEWMAYDQVHTSTSWHQTASICHTVASGLFSKPPKYEKFLPQKFRAKGRISANEIRARLGTLRPPADPQGV